MPYLALFLVLAWWTLRLGTGWADGCFLDLVNLAFHEAGHVFLTPFGRTVHFLGGTFGQLFVPALLVWYFLFRRPQRAGAAFCLWWFGENLVNVARYMADARKLQMPLVGGGEHDWNELFFTFGLLDEDSVHLISATTHLVGVVIMIIGLAWLLMFVLPPRYREDLSLNKPKLGFFLE